MSLILDPHAPLRASEEPKPESIADTFGRFLTADDGALTIETHQEIPDGHMQALRRQYLDSGSERAKDFHMAASIPVVIIEQMMREGINLLQDNVPWADVKAWLIKKGLEGFITSKKV